MMTMPCTRADCAIGGYTGRTSRVFCGGLMLPPQKTRVVRPVYPPIAQSARVQGIVIIEATIGPDGSVKDA
ncbi:MAG: energy transducer TonB, partial [Acidimicrobiia bacterium]